MSSWWAAITQEQATLLAASVSSGVTLLVAFFVAHMTSRKDTRLKQIERQFAFADRRETQYSIFLTELNNTMQVYFERMELQSNNENLSISLQEFQRLEAQAQKLDTEMMKLRITAPTIVANKVSNVNGHAQTAILSLQPGAREDFNFRQFEHAKEEVLSLMRRDVELIQDASDLADYRKKVVALGKCHSDKLKVANQ